MLFVLCKLYKIETQCFLPGMEEKKLALSKGRRSFSIYSCLLNPSGQALAIETLKTFSKIQPCKRRPQLKGRLIEINFRKKESEWNAKSPLLSPRFLSLLSFLLSAETKATDKRNAFEFCYLSQYRLSESQSLYGTGYEIQSSETKYVLPAFVDHMEYACRRRAYYADLLIGQAYLSLPYFEIEEIKMPFYDNNAAPADAPLSKEITRTLTVCPFLNMTAPPLPWMTSFTMPFLLNTIPCM